jgi:hypothetical protein
MAEPGGQLREGAGQVESKLNQEFIDWLQKWSTPILLVISLTALGFVAYRWYEGKVAKRVNSAFAEVEQASSPEALRQVAVDYSGVRAVPDVARLRAADMYLEAARRGLKPGAAVQPGKPAAPEDVLSDADRDSMLEQARGLYQQVLDDEGNKPAKALAAMGAAYGLAAVAECRGDLDGAKAAYERVIALAERASFPAQKDIAQKRIDKLPALAERPVLISDASLPKPPEPPAPPAAAPGGEAPAASFQPSSLPLEPVVTSPGDGQPPTPQNPAPAPEAPPANPAPTPPAQPEQPPP